MKAIEIKNLNKWFEMNSMPTLMDNVASIFNKKEKKRIHALSNISLSVGSGEFIGIIGANGSGKSTLLKVIAKTLTPDNGLVNIYGKVVPFLELGLGFNPEMTAKENVLLYLSVMGLSKKEINKKLNGIIRFAELENFQDMPIKDYSSGMHARLAFASAIRAEGDIYLIDEVLAVGDASFQKKCFKVFGELKKAGKTMLLISHDLSIIKSFCNRVILLDKGEIVSEGRPDSVIADYKKILGEREILQEEKLQKRIEELEALYHKRESCMVQMLSDKTGLLKELENIREEINWHKNKITPKRFGSNIIKITNVELFNGQSKKTNIFRTGEKIKIRILYYSYKRLENPEFGISIHDNNGLWIFGPNTKYEKIKFLADGKGEIGLIIEEIPFLNGTYLLTVAIHNYNRSEVYDYIEKGIKFEIQNKNQKEEFGSIRIPYKWRFNIKNGKT